MTELLVAGKMQITEEVQNAESKIVGLTTLRFPMLTALEIGLTIAADGTGIRNIDHIARNVYVTNIDHHARVSFGVHSAPSHTSQGQLDGWDNLTSDYFSTYNASPRGQLAPADPRSLAVKSTSAMADHAEDHEAAAHLVNEPEAAFLRLSLARAEQLSS